MQFKTLVLTSISAAAMFAAGCGSTADGPANTANSNASNANAVVTNSNNPLAATTPTPETTSNAAPTLTPVYKAYCAAVVKKDEAALRKVYSTDTIKFFEEEMKADGVKSLMEYLADDQVTNELCEARNETITGDTAVAEIRSAGYPNGIKVVFVKEGGEWKLTNRSPEVPMK